MLRYVVIFCLLACTVAGQTLTPTEKALPSVASAGFIGIPRQQAVCMSTAGELVTFWGNTTARLFRTTDTGSNWTEMSGDVAYSIKHDHLAVLADTVYDFSSSPYAVHEFGQSIAAVVSGTFTQVLRSREVTSSLGSNTEVSDVVFSGQPVFGDTMVAIGRGITANLGPNWWESYDRGRTWNDSGTGTWAAGDVNSRIGLIANPPDTPAFLYYQGDPAYTVNVYYYQPLAHSWDRHGAAAFATGLFDRFYSGIIANDTTWVIIWRASPEGYVVYRAPAYSDEAPTYDSLYSEDIPSNGGYCALQQIQNCNGVMAYYLHANGHPYARLYYGGTWSAETELSTTVYTNLQAPYQVPTSHGDLGYLFLSNGSGGELIVVAITGLTSSTTKLVKVRK